MLDLQLDAATEFESRPQLTRVLPVQHFYQFEVESQ